jgi:hypothetical protein
LAFVEVEIFSEAHVVVIISVDVLAPTIEKLMQAKNYENRERGKRQHLLVSIVLATTTS